MGYSNDSLSTNVVRHPLSLALFGSLLATALPAFAQDSRETTDLGRVTVTGSLIPQTKVENHTPVLTVTAEDIQTRGFTSIAEVLQQSSLTTGGLQGGQSSAAFTQGVPKRPACSAWIRATPST